MEENIPSFPQDERGNKLPLSQAIEVLIEAEIQALKHAEKVSTLLIQALDQRVAELENLHIEMKQRRDIPRSLKKAYNDQYWWNALCVDIRAYRDHQEGSWRYLEGEQEQYRKRVVALKQLQEDVHNLYPNNLSI